MDDKPIKLAGCVILDDYNRLLLLHRDRGDDSCWELPGGKLEEGETAAAAAIRELQEELGVKVRLIKALGSDNFSQADRQFHYSWFQAVITEGQPLVQEPDTFDDVDYFGIEDLPELALSNNMLRLQTKLSSGEVRLDG